MTPRDAISYALWDHLWARSGAPSDETVCCADVALRALEKAGYTVIETPLTSSNTTAIMVDHQEPK